MKRIKISKEEEKQICEDYLKLKNIGPIAIKYNRTRNVISRVVKRNNIEVLKRIGKHSKLSCNDNYFDKIDSSKKAYFLGLIVSDGSVSNRALSISLQERDKIILEKFIEDLEYSGKLSFVPKKKHNHQNAYVLTVYSRKLVQDLSKYGVVCAKSHKTYFPDIPEEFYSHFIRGVFDGDGYIGEVSDKSNRFSITGNRDLIESIRNILSDKLNIRKSAISFKNKNFETSVQFVYSKGKELLKIRDYLYFESDDVFIPRKKEKFFTLNLKIFKEECEICGKEIHAKGLCKNHYQNERNKWVKKGLEEFDQSKIKWVKV